MKGIERVKEKKIRKTGDNQTLYTGSSLRKLDFMEAFFFYRIGYITWKRKLSEDQSRSHVELYLEIKTEPQFEN